MQVRRKDTGILKDGTVLNNGLLGMGNLYHLFETLVQEVNLKVERPTFHVGIEVLQIRVIVNGFEPGGPSVTMGQHLGQRGLATTNVSCYCDVHLI